MRRLNSIATQYAPLALFVMTCIAVGQFVFQHVPARSRLEQYMHAIATFAHENAWILFAVAVLFWLVVFAGYFHDRHAARRGDVKQGGWLMDALDRLTNRRALEQKLAQEPEPQVIDAEKLASALKSKVIGQDAVCDDLAAQIRRRLALRQRNKPIGVFMLAGPPGTGKTYLAKCLAAELDRTLLHFDMTQFSSGAQGATQLFGASKGYVGSNTYGKLTAALRDTPDAVVLLDEIEKAHPEIHKNFLTAWNDGFVTEASDGKQISTTRAIFMLTTNAATDTLHALSDRFADDADELRRASTNALGEAGFAPEVMNRIDRIFVFKSLTGLDIARVAALEIETMIKSYGLDVAEEGIDPDILIGMIRRQNRLGAGASSRDLVRAVEESLADTLIDAKQHGHTKVSLVSVDGSVIAKPQ
ncbi:ATP-dependent Clp protease ATP-binding subunit [Trinickia dinghuensis]|uniref:ATP-dependent Clp protease ATP-binding subunit n=2 Tax=Trinickia dinghuensis TaxID=2291023 RepID=A0A3D8JTB8_9BURK|nr:ATP-dependent Clp protease ATP-binding subunit [Trinickia dinghuensis]